MPNIPKYFLYASAVDVLPDVGAAVGHDVETVHFLGLGDGIEGAGAFVVEDWGMGFSDEISLFSVFCDRGIGGPHYRVTDYKIRTSAVIIDFDETTARTFLDHFEPAASKAFVGAEEIRAV